jgi:hypothetical protein
MVYTLGVYLWKNCGTQIICFLLCTGTVSSLCPIKNCISLLFQSLKKNLGPNLAWFWWWNMTFCIIQYLEFVHCVESKSTKFWAKCSEMVLSLSLVQEWRKYLSSVGPLLVLMPEHCSVCCIFKHSVVDQIQHDMQCMYSVTMRWLLNHCREWKNKIYYIFWVCVCSCSYPAWKAHGTILYCHLWPVWICHIFSHYVISSVIFGKKVLNIKCVLWFSLQLVWNISHSEKN